MATRPHGIYNNQSAANYINRKGINELFEAIMTGLMVQKPDDHIAYIRECLDKVQNNPHRVRWDIFIPNSKGAVPPRPSLARNRQKPLPPVRSSNVTPKSSTHSSERQASTKSIALPPIDNHKKPSQNLPIVFILSSGGSTKLCSRLLQRYNQITYLSINDIANIDDDDMIDFTKYEYRYDSIQNAINQHRSNSHGFLISGHIEEKRFFKNWQDKLGRIDLIILLSSQQQTISNRNFHIIQIDSRNDFDIILADAIHSIDEIFPHNINNQNENSSLIQSKTNHFTLPIIFCIDNHRLSLNENFNNKDQPTKLSVRPSIDEEFDMAIEENEEESNNSFIYTLCERLAEEFTFKHIHYGDFDKALLNFDQLKTLIIESMSIYAGYIIDHFPTSFDDLQKFQKEVGPCSVLIYIGGQPTEVKDDELNGIVGKFKAANKAIYIDCRMEVDEIYEDLKKDIFKHI